MALCLKFVNLFENAKFPWRQLFDIDLMYLKKAVYGDIFHRLVKRVT